MEKHFGLIAFVTITIAGSIAIFHFGDFLLMTFAPHTSLASGLNESSSYIPTVADNDEVEDIEKDDLIPTPESEIMPEEIESNIEDTSVEKSTSVSACPKPTSTTNLDRAPMSRTHSLPADYTPRTLRAIDGDWGTYCIQEETYQAFVRMVKDAKKDGMDIRIYSGYRSYSTQDRLFKNWQARNPEGAEYPAVAEPGHSEHQLGTTVDLKSGSSEFGYSNPFGETLEYQWMREHAHEYGFVQSYPEGKSDITGYIPEPWHWRYLGTETATKIKQKGTTITEYLLGD